MTDTHSLIGTLQRRIDDTLSPLLSGVRRVALLDFPSYANVGDSTIWLGTVTHLASRESPTVVYTADRQSYVESHLRARLGDGAILITGGGNLGDLWEPHQRFREQVIASFCGHRIIQLPQSIWFQDVAAERRAQRCFDGHGDLTILVRDRRSFDIAANAFRAPIHLCPDMAFSLGPLARVGTPFRSVVRVIRRDRESAESVHDGGPDDWTAASRGPLGRAHDVLRGALTRYPRRARALRRPLSALYGPLARARLAHGVALLSSGDTVITDRLHGHILCVLLGVRHVVFGDRHGKIESFRDAWTGDTTLASWCASRADAERRVASSAPGER